MRILMTTDTLGGVWNYATDLISALRPHGVELVLATLGGPLSPAQRRVVASLSNVQLLESQYKLEWMDDPWADVRRSGEWLREFENEFCPDVIHLNGFAHGQESFLAPVMVVAHSCCLSWWAAVKQETPPAQWDQYRGEVKKGLAGADLLVAPSRSMLEAMEYWYEPKIEKRVIYNGSRMIADRTTKDPVILSAGRLWDEAKNIAMLDQIARDLPWPIEVAGSIVGPDGIPIEPRHVRTLGQLDSNALAERMSSAAIYTLPAYYEPFGLSILEAALAGCALVIGDIRSLREIWEDSAIYVDPQRPAEISRGLRWLIEHPSARALMAAKSRQRARSFTLELMAEKYLAEYRHLVEKSQATQWQPNGVETLA